MATNTEITLAIFQLVQSFANSNDAELAIPGKKFKTPSKKDSVWLELSVSPNDLDDTLNGKQNFKRGMYQINVCGKPDRNPLTLTGFSDTITELMQKGTVLFERVKVVRTPYTMQLIELDDRVILPVTIEYSE